MRFHAARRSAVSLTVAVLLLWVLERRRLLDTDTLVNAAARAPGTLLALALLLLTPIVVGSVRYRAVLQAMGRSVPMSVILAATVISSAVANWLPASAGVMEVMRFGLVVRSTRGGAAALSKTDLAVAGLVDRSLGLATIAMVGLLGGVYLLATAGAGRGGGMWVIVALTVVLAAGCALPFVAVRVPRSARAAWPAWAAAPLDALAPIKTALRQVELNHPAFALASLASLSISVTSILAMYLAIRLFAPATPLLAVAVAFPLITVAAVLPANIAGFGGNQVAAAVVFGALALDARAAVLASLLVSAVGLVTTSIAGAIWAPRVWHKQTSAADLMTADDASTD